MTALTKYLLLVTITSTALLADLTQVKAEPNLERRSQLALDFANVTLDDALKTYQQDPYSLAAPLNNIREAVELSYTSLKETGKRARRSPKYFKRVELRMRELLKRIDTLEREVAYEDRDEVATLRAHVTEVHEKLLGQIMGKKE